MELFNAFLLLRWQDAVDFVVLALALYVLIRWASEAHAFRIASGVVILHVGSLLARHFGLVITGWVLEGAAATTVVFLLIVFQPEIRKALTRLDGRVRFMSRRRSRMEITYRILAEAAFSMSRKRIGALVVLVRRDSVGELTDGGVSLNADLSNELLCGIFQKESPLHDGAVVLEEDRISKARVFLPLTHRADVDRSWGSRHRAAVGLAERSDALVLTVSEQTGHVHLMDGKNIRRIESAAALVEALTVGDDRPMTSLATRVRQATTANLKVKAVALSLALVLWAASSLLVAASVRTVTAPVEFIDVPPGLAVTAQTATEVRLQLRGNSWLLDSENFGRLVAHCSLDGAAEGWQNVTLQQDALDLPHGLTVESIFPHTISVELTPEPH